jgi:hypothetical protein
MSMMFMSPAMMAQQQQQQQQQHYSQCTSLTPSTQQVFFNLNFLNNSTLLKRLDVYFKTHNTKNVKKHYFFLFLNRWSAYK